MGEIIGIMQTINKTEAEEALTPKQIRDMLGIDNDRIQEICKMADIKLKRNDRGLTYFTRDDAKVLKRFCSEPVAKYPVSREITPGMAAVSHASLSQLFSTIKGLEGSICDKLASLLDEKLEGMDEVVLELVRVKTENESLRTKISDLDKENYGLKKELKSFVKTTFGFYKKTNNKKKEYNFR